MLGSIEPSEFAIAVITEDINTLKQIPGIGPKSAQRIVLELKDKLKKEQQIVELEKASLTKSKIKNAIIADDKVTEATTALQVLGYTKTDIDKVLEQIDKVDITLEEIIKQALKILSTK